MDKLITANTINYLHPNSDGDVGSNVDYSSITDVDVHIFADSIPTISGETAIAEGILTDPCILILAGKCTNDPDPA